MCEPRSHAYMADESAAAVKRKYRITYLNFEREKNDKFTNFYYPRHNRNYKNYITKL